MRYLDPKADLTFKKIFGGHPQLTISLLNALLPLDKGDEVVSIVYLPTELAPRTPTRKNTIVDVRCKDNRGRHFIVEMQMVWSKEYKQRMVFNAAKAYVGQLNEGENYDLLQPVYSLNLVNDIFEKDIDDWYHHYRLVHNRYNNKVIEGLQLVLVELPKFTPHTMTEKKMAALWLRFLTEIDAKTRKAPQELLDNADVKKALDIVEESAYSEAEMYAYDKFWDIIRREKGRANELERFKKEIEQSKKEIEQSKKEIEQSKKEIEQSKKEIEQKDKALEQKDSIIKTMVKGMLAKGTSVEDIAMMMGKTPEEIKAMTE